MAFSLYRFQLRAFSEIAVGTTPATVPRAAILDAGERSMAGTLMRAHFTPTARPTVARHFAATNAQVVATARADI